MMEVPALQAEWYNFAKSCNNFSRSCYNYFESCNSFSESCNNYFLTEALLRCNGGLMRLSLSLFRSAAEALRQYKVEAAGFHNRAASVF